MGLRKIFKREPPANGGNTFELQKILDAKETNIKDYIRNDLAPNIVKNQYTFWELLQFQADYFASTLQFTFKDNDLDPKLYVLMRCNFLYGNVGLYKKGEDLIPIVESSFEMDGAGNIKKIVGYSAYEVVMQTGTLAENTHKFKTKYTITKKDMENYARLHVGSWGFGAVVRWTKFILQQESLLKKIYIHSYLLNKKITYNVNDISAANVEVKRFFNDDYPFLINIDTISPNANKFEVEGVGATGNSNDSESIFYYYEKFLKIYYEMLGRRMNTDRKGERNITSEVEASQEQFLILENEMKINKINFLEDVKKLVGKDYELLNQQVEGSGQQVEGTNQGDGRNKGEKVNDLQGVSNTNSKSKPNKD